MSNQSLPHKFVLRTLVCALVNITFATFLILQSQPPAAANGIDLPEAAVNSQMFPKRILLTGIKLDQRRLSPNALQLAENLQLTSLLERIENLRTAVAREESAPSLERLAARQDLYDAIQKSYVIIQRATLDVDYSIAEIESELSVYREWLAAFSLKRDKALNASILASGISNMALWSTSESLVLPAVKYPTYVLPSGVVGILAGVVPSVASMYALKAASGAKYTSEADPNMLAQVFGYPGNEETALPKSVWLFLNQTPANEKTNRSRRDQLIDRWIADKSIPTFTNRESIWQRDILTASAPHPKCLSIDTLNMRTVMLQQLAAEIKKMKRMLLELSMTLEGTKSLAPDK